MFIRVGEEGKPAFRLRKGEEGLSVFNIDAVDPALTEVEFLEAFRAGSLLIYRSREHVEGKGLVIETISGGASLPVRLRDAHAEIRCRPAMTRDQFKKAFQELE